MSKLVVFMSGGTTLEVPLARERTTIGRRSDNDICLPDLAVSGEHAVVVTILADSFLEDLASTNGTLVNGNAIAKHFLRDRDQVEIGRHRLIYCVDDDASMSAEIVGLARMTARAFGERVEAAKPLAASRVVQTVAPPQLAEAASSVPPAAASSAPTAKPSRPREVASPPAQADAAALPTEASPPEVALAALKVLSGFNAGASIPLVKTETTIGRPGVQVASIVKGEAGFRLLPVEGTVPPAVNGRPAERDGVDLASGDVIEIAGTRLEFVDVTQGSGKSDVAA